MGVSREEGIKGCNLNCPQSFCNRKIKNSGVIFIIHCGIKRRRNHSFQSIIFMRDIFVYQNYEEH